MISLEIEELVKNKLGEYKTAGNEYKIKTCPFCGRSNWKFYLNSKTGLFHCKSGSCDEKGSFPKLLHKFGIKTNFKQSNKYETNETVLKLTPEDQKEFVELNENQIEWFKNRGISKDSLKYINVCSRKNIIVFPYFQENELKIIKYRDYGTGENYKKKVWQQPGGIPTALGLDLIKENEPVIICEGEIDYLSWIEAGVYNVISLPFGTSNMDWVSNNWKKLEKIKTFYICMDNDNAGVKAEKILIGRLGISRVKKIDLGTYNDVNDILLSEGKERLINLYENPKEYSIDGIYNVKDIKINNDTTEYTKSFRNLDLILGGFRNGEVTIWTGEPGSGKTTILNQISIFAMENKNKVGVYSGEMKKEELLKWLGIQILGVSACDNFYHTAKERYYYKLKTEEKEKLNNLINDKFFFIESDTGVISSDDLFQKIEILIKKYGVKHIIIDNLMQINIECENKNEGQKTLVRKLVDIAKKTDIHIHLVAHPKKINKNEKPSMYDIHGASEIVNLVHNIIRLKRVQNIDDTEFDTVVLVQKNREFGDIGTAGLYFDRATKRFFSNAAEKDKKYFTEQEKNGVDDIW